MRTRLRRRADESGQILIGVIALSMVLIITLAVATTALANAVFTTNIAADHTDAQSAAQSADNWVYAWVNNNAGALASRVSAGQSVWMGLTTPRNAGFPFTDTNSSTPVPSTGLPWLQPQANGALANCTTYNQTCVQVQLRYSSPKLVNTYSGDQTINEQVLVQIRARTMCHSAVATGNSGCPTWTYQSLLRRRTFLDYLYFTNYETVAPDLYAQAVAAQTVGPQPVALFSGISATPPISTCASHPSASGCLQVVYGGAGTLYDLVNGPIHTNSNQVAICGTPKFSSPSNLIGPSGSGSGGPWIEVSTTGSATAARGCGTTTLPPVIPTPSIRMPNGDLAQLKQLASGDGTVFPSGTIIQGCDGAPSGQTGCDGHTTGVVVAAPGASPVYFSVPPPTGVLYVSDNASVAGRFKGDWTIAASGNITVGTGQSEYRNNLWLDCQASITQNGGAPPASCPDMVGLVAANNIVLNDSNYSNLSAYTGNSTNYPVGAGMEVSAAMMALGDTSSPHTCGTSTVSTFPDCGSIYSQQWYQAPPTPAATAADPAPTPYPAPELVIYGAMVSYYRGLFGVYATGGTSQGAQAGIDYGMVKNFNYDSRFMSQQPPWFLQPTASSWAIIGFTQTGATTG